MGRGTETFIYYYFLIVNMKGMLLDLALLGLIFLAFVAVHEAGHYAAAAYFDLGPSLMLGEPTTDSLMGGLVGIRHRVGGPFERQIVILSALVPPFGIGGALRLTKNEMLRLAGTAFLVLAVAALLPFPGSDMGNLLSLLG